VLGMSTCDCSAADRHHTWFEGTQVAPKEAHTVEAL
jgi:hypothetical protein